MGIRAAVVLVAGIAACSDGAVVLDIDVGTTSATEVELVIAEQPLDGKTVQGPRGLLPNQTVWTRDSTARTVAPVANGHAKFHIQAGDQNATPTIVAVGFAGETAEGFVVVPALPVDRPGIYTATLAASTPSSQVGSTPHLDVWASGQTVRQGPVCFSIIGDRAIVPADDPDCDGFVAPNECPGGDYIFHDMQPAKVTKARDASCLGTFDLSTGAGTNLGNTCRLGGTGCTDGSVGQALTCQPASICMPDAACACTGLDLPCLANAMFPATLPPGMGHEVVIDCTVELDANGAACPLGKVLPARLPNASTRTCTDATTFIALPLQPPLDFQDTLDFDSGARYVQAPNNGTCNVDLTLDTAPRVPTNDIYDTDRAIIDFHAINGFDVLIPLRITYARNLDGCATAGTLTACTVNPTSGNGVLACFTDGATNP